MSPYPSIVTFDTWKMGTTDSECSVCAHRTMSATLRTLTGCRRIPGRLSSVMICEMVASSTFCLSLSMSTLVTTMPTVQIRDKGASK